MTSVHVGSRDDLPAGAMKAVQAGSHQVRVDADSVFVDVDNPAT